MHQPPHTQIPYCFHPCLKTHPGTAACCDGELPTSALWKASQAATIFTAYFHPTVCERELVKEYCCSGDINEAAAVFIRNTRPILLPCPHCWEEKHLAAKYKENNSFPDQDIKLYSGFLALASAKEQLLPIRNCSQFLSLLYIYF